MIHKFKHTESWEDKVCTSYAPLGAEGRTVLVLKFRIEVRFSISFPGNFGELRVW